MVLIWLILLKYFGTCARNFVFKWHTTDATLHISNKKVSYTARLFVSSANITLQETESGRAGLKSDLSLICSGFDERTLLQTSANITKRGKSFDVNKRAVFHSLESGTGYEGLASFCGIMNMPCMSTSAYYQTGRQHPRHCRGLHNGRAQKCRSEVAKHHP